VSTGVIQSSEVLEQQAVHAESSGRDWGSIGAGFVAAFAVVAIYVTGIWALVVLVQALA